MHLYLHVPFCARRCSYCDFAIAVRREVPSAAYVDTVLAEWRRVRAEEAWVSATPVRSVHLGGGTPSRLRPAELVRLLDAIHADAALEPDAEIAIEANPDDVNADAVRAWRDAGVNRASLGAQSFDARVLEWMHRVHGPEQIGRAVGILRAAGFENLSLDLIFALPPELERDWTRDLDMALALEPAHLSLYGLTVEPHTPLGRWTARGDVHVADDSRYATEYLAAAERFAAMGWEHYEVSNAARPGFRSVHNQAYWARASYLGLGPSAHSAHDAVRRWNIRDWPAWQSAILAGRSGIDASEVLDADQQQLEARYLGLRTSAGAGISLIPASHRHRWVESGWAVESGDRICLTTEGWLRLDALVASL